MKRTYSVLNQMLLAIILVALLPQLARAADDSKSLTVVPIVQAPSFAKRALVVGVKNYETAAGLNYTTNDARAFADMLRTRFAFPPESITLMTDDADTPERLHPTYTRLRNAINRLVTGLNDKSEVIFFYSGHGARVNDEDYLVPQDGDPADITGTCVSYTKLRQQLETGRPHRALLIVDACRNLTGGKAAGSSGFGSSPHLVGPEIAELMSCQPTEISREGAAGDFQQGVFTHFLLEGLEGSPDALASGSNMVTFDSLRLFVQGKVSQYVTHTYGVEQNPDGRASLGEMVLALGNSETGKSVQPPTQPVPEPVQPPITLPTAPPTIPISPQIKINPTDNAEMILIPAGPFLMGDADQEDNPRRTVTLDAYYIYKNLVTVAQYQKFCTATGCQMPDAPTWGWKDDHPIVNVIWDEAKAYCDWAGTQLPTEAQWEKAARGTDGRKFPWGNEFDTSKLQCSKASIADTGSTAPIGRFLAGASPYGVLDMAGNVWQWCADWYDESYTKSASTQNPAGPGLGTMRVLRGGSWINYGEFGFRSAYRFRYDPTGSKYVYFGFRCVARAGS